MQPVTAPRLQDSGQNSTEKGELSLALVFGMVAVRLAFCTTLLVQCLRLRFTG